MIPCNRFKLLIQMNKFFITTASAILLGVLTLLSSCSISSGASRRTGSASDDVEITEEADGVKTIRVKKQPVVRRTTLNEGSTENGGKTVMQTFNVADGWKEITVSSYITVEYTPAANYSPINVICYAWLMDYVYVTVSGGELRIGLKNTKVIENKNLKKPIKVVLSAPPVNSMAASGAGSIKVLGDMNINGNFSVVCSGASGVELRDVKAARDVSFILSGASGVKVNNMTCGAATLEMGGASNITVQKSIKARSVLLNPSGASTLSVNGICEATELRALSTGASTLSIQKADGSWIEMEVGGASTGRIRSATSARLYVDASGASDAEVNHFNGTSLDVRANGVSEVTVDDISATRVIAEVGYNCTAKLSGNAGDAQFTTNNGTINASRLKVNQAYVSLNGKDAKVTVKADKIYTDD